MNYDQNLTQPENYVLCRFLLTARLVAIYDPCFKPMAATKLCLKLVAKMVVICKLYCKL